MAAPKYVVALPGTSVSQSARASVVNSLVIANIGPQVGMLDGPVFYFMKTGGLWLKEWFLGSFHHARCPFIS